MPNDLMQAAPFRESDRYPSLLEHAVDTTVTHVAIIDAFGTIQYANQACLTTTMQPGSSTPSLS